MEPYVNRKLKYTPDLLHGDTIKRLSLELWHEKKKKVWPVEASGLFASSKPVPVN